jgi:NitT/TauT family transport system permease protein
MFRNVIIPASLPGILTALRISLGTALSVLFFTETFGTEFGLGYFIMDAWMRVNYIDMFSGILVLSIMGLLLFVLLDIIERVCCRWKNKSCV